MLCTCPNRLPNGDWLRVEVGQIFEVHTEMEAVHHSLKEKSGRIAYFKVFPGEKIEIRFPYEWHFRTEDNVYMQVSEETLLKNCRLFGTIWERVRFNNKASLEEILRIGLYDKAL